MSLSNRLAPLFLGAAVLSSIATSGSETQGPDYYEQLVTFDHVVDVVDHHNGYVFMGIDVDAEPHILDDELALDLYVALDGGDPVTLTLYDFDANQVRHDVITQDGMYSYVLPGQLWCQHYDAPSGRCTSGVVWELDADGGFATVTAHYELLVQGANGTEGAPSVWAE